MNKPYLINMEDIWRKLLSGFLPAVLVVAFFHSGPLMAVNSQISKIRKRKIAAIIKEIMDANERLSDPYVQEAVFDKVNNVMKLEPEGKPLNKGISEIAAEIRKKVAKRYPSSTKDIAARAQKDAEKKYHLKKKLDNVTVTVIRGEHSFQVSGIFYRYGIGGNSVVIGDHSPVAFMDLAPEDRAKFDKAFCELMRKKYVKDKISQYNRRKQSYLNLLFSEELDKMVKENEQRGYIYVWGKWRTPKQVTEYLLQQSIKLQQKMGLPETAGNEEPGSGLAEQGADASGAVPVDISDVDAGEESKNTDNDADALRLARLKQEVEKRQMEIAGSHYGIDADQGFRKGTLLVLIGLTQDEVDLLTGQKSSGDTSTIAYKTGPIDNVTFSFVNHILYQITITYRIGPFEGMQLLLEAKHDAYGDSIEGKELKKKEKERLARLYAVRHLCPKDKNGKDTHKWDKKGICTKCGVRKEDLNPAPPPKHIVETWQGNVITARLEADLTADLSNFTKFVFTKANMKIKEEQDKILEDERLRRAEEERQKKIDEYKIK